MYPYHYFPEYAYQQFGTYMPFPAVQSFDQNEFDRQPPGQNRELERRVNRLERQNEEQVRELTRINNEIRRINQEINRLSQNDVRTTRRLNRLNQRLRAVENRLAIPFHALEDGF